MFLVQSLYTTNYPEEKVYLQIIEERFSSPSVVLESDNTYSSAPCEEGSCQIEPFSLGKTTTVFDFV